MMIDRGPQELATAAQHKAICYPSVSKIALRRIERLESPRQAQPFPHVHSQDQNLFRFGRNLLKARQ